MPENPLTVVLKDFRSYRPTNHREFLEHVQDRAVKVDVKGFALQDPNSAGKKKKKKKKNTLPLSFLVLVLTVSFTALYLSNVDQIRAFRHRHWNFTKEYIIKYTDHPVATGGSPIVTW
jgi:indoleamine 2,3-dioxygenase